MLNDEWPQNGDKFYWVRSDTGTVCEGMWIDGLQSCEFRRSIGIVFRSRETAKSAIRMQQAKQEDRLIAEG